MTETYAKNRDSKAEDAVAVAELLAAAGKAVATYEWIIKEHPILASGGGMLEELRQLREAMAACGRRGFRY